MDLGLNFKNMVQKLHLFNDLITSPIFDQQLKCFCGVQHLFVANCDSRELKRLVVSDSDVDIHRLVDKTKYAVQALSIKYTTLLRLKIPHKNSTIILMKIVNTIKRSSH